MIKAGIIGGAGYTAGELIRLLINHPETEIVFINSTSNAGNKITDVHWPFTLWGGTPGPVQVMGGIIIALWIAAVALAVVGLLQRIGRR